MASMEDRGDDPEPDGGCPRPQPGGVAINVAALAISDVVGERATRACDREVGVLLSARDPVELQRADILVRELGCDVGRRWAAVP